jgi:hypothetical protein
MGSVGYPASAVERAMNVQEVILRAIDGRLKCYQATEILGTSGRQMRWWEHRYERFGYDGLFDRRRQLPGLCPLGVRHPPKAHGWFIAHSRLQSAKT